MALYDQLPIFRVAYKLNIRIFQLTHEFPREYRYSLGEDMKHDSLRLMRQIYRAKRAQEEESPR